MIYTILFGIFLTLPMAICAAAEPVSETILLEAKDETKFIVPKEVALLSNTIKHLIEIRPILIELNQRAAELQLNSSNVVETLPKETTYSLGQMSATSFDNVLSLMKIAYKVKDKQERIQKISALITAKLANTMIEQWQSSIDDIEYLDIEILREPLADSMIKYIYQLDGGNQCKIEERISSLPITDEFKVLLAKHYYFNYGEARNFIDPLASPIEKEIPVDYGFSIEELLAHNKLPKINSYKILELHGLRINDLTGLTLIPNITSVHYLWLRNNKLTTLPENIFNGFTNVIEINLERNKFTDLPENRFNGLYKLRSVGIRGNPFTTEIEKSLKARLAAKNLVIMSGSKLQ